MQQLNDFVKKFTKKDLIEKDSEVIKVQRRFYLAEKSLIETRDKIKSVTERDCVAMGEFLGELKYKEFKPSIALLEKLSKISEKKVFVDEKAEWLFLCGRDLFSKSIEKSNLKPKKRKGLVLVQNSFDENLGFGRMVAPLTKENQNRVVVRNLLDRGDFLRRESRRR